MRTTINLEDDVLRAVKSLARERQISLGAAVSELIRQALRPRDEASYDGDFPVFAVREGAAPITPEMVKSALEDD